MELLRDECSVRKRRRPHPMTNGASSAGAHSKPRLTRNSTGFGPGAEATNNILSRPYALESAHPYQEMVLKFTDQ
jgi:hypothetical protein